MNREVHMMNSSTETNGLAAVASSPLLPTNSWEVLTTSTDIFGKSLKLGRVRGIVTIHTNPGLWLNNNSGYLQVAQELINRDILTVFVCDTADMPDQETMLAKLLLNAGDGLAEFCEFIGVPPVLCMNNSTNGNDIENFYNKLAQQTGVEVADLPVAAVGPIEVASSVPAMESGPVEEADRIDGHIHGRRIGIQWCDRCGGHFSAFS